MRQHPLLRLIARRRLLFFAGVLIIGLVLAFWGFNPATSSKWASGLARVSEPQRNPDGTEAITIFPLGSRTTPREFAGITLDGKRLRLSDSRGKVTVVNVWAHWCSPCREEAPALEQTWRRVSSHDVQFVGVNIRDDAAPARAFVRHFGLTYPSVADPEGVLTLAFRDVVPLTTLPSTVVLDRQGRVAARVLGEASASTLRGLVEEALAEGTPS